MSYLALKMGKRGFIRCMKNTITRISMQQQQNDKFEIIKN